MPFKELVAFRPTKHVVCLSGGESSAMVAIEVHRKYGNDSLVLLNHDIHPRSEDADIKRFKQEVSDFCGVPITYANMAEWDSKDQFDVVVEAGAFKVKTGSALCTNRMKTAPFVEWLKNNCYPNFTTVYYGFDSSPRERTRIQRRSSAMAAMGYKTDFPLAYWKRTLLSTAEVGIVLPSTYQTFKHANCIGCLKAGTPHWYVVFCTRPDIWARAVWAEEEIGYTILLDRCLLDWEPIFKTMRAMGVKATEHMGAKEFKAAVAAASNVEYEDNGADGIPCECSE